MMNFNMKFEETTSAFNMTLGNTQTVSTPGKSAYEYAKEAGFAGTEEEFAEKLAEPSSKDLYILCEFGGTESNAVFQIDYDVNTLLATLENGGSIHCVQQIWYMGEIAVVILPFTGYLPSGNGGTFFFGTVLPHISSNMADEYHFVIIQFENSSDRGVAFTQRLTLQGGSSDGSGIDIDEIVNAVIDALPDAGGMSFTVDETLSFENGVLSVNRAEEPDPDNTLPITAAAVYATVGNIETLLGTI